MRHMKELGFNCVKLWAMWNWIEKEPGRFCFAELDELVSLAVKNNLGVIINTIPEGAPYWTYIGNDEDLYQTADGQVVKYGGPANIPSGGWPGLCMDTPVFAAKVADFIERTAAHFANTPGILTIDVWNEPHLEPMYDYRSNMLCYCRHSIREFRTWLRKKYVTLDALSKAWYRNYTDWEQVTPPPRFGTWADMLDWRRFWLDNLCRWLRLRVEASRRGAPNVPVQTHVAYSGILGNRIVGGLANELGDEFLLAREVDLFGLSSFPKWLMGDEHLYRHLLHNEMVASASHGKPFYQMELQGGAGKPGLLGGEVPTASDIRLWNWNTIAAGGKGTIYWQYAPEPAGIESPGFGLTGFKGEDTPRSLSAAECAKALNTPILEGARRVQSCNAVYVSRDTSLLCFASERREEMYAGSLSGVFQAAYLRGIPIEFFHQDNFDELVDSPITFLYLPMPLVLSEEEIAVLYRFVERGGTLVSEACPGLYRPDGLLESDSIALRTLFGLQHNDIEGMRNWGEVTATWTDTKKPFTGRFYRQLTKTAENADTVTMATFSDDEPALTQYAIGKGTAIWIGSYPSYHFEHSRDITTGELLTRWMHPGGYPEWTGILYTPEQPCENNTFTAPVFRLLDTAEGKRIVAVNHTATDVTAEIQHAGGVIPIKLPAHQCQLVAI
ncbi:MAG: beta-galactosidase [Defluviitaleaceae bacterium]|nr:beta-galactosidase [Defluviitaleaceae bacterium]MCL2239137.1 beta-galactosidase [Defluviitaleaceae bacterium]